ncbi:MAG: lipopolysaccharide biosynthesis protein [Chloroflexota bacterium]
MIRLIVLRILESYFRHRWAYLLPIVLMAMLGVVFVLITKPTYTAEGVLYVKTESYLATLTSAGSSSASWWSTPSQVVEQEITELLKTDAFIRAIIQKTDLEAEMDGGSSAVSEIIESTRENVWPASLGDNQIQVNAVHEDPTIAFQMVNAVIDGYLQWRVNADLAESEVAQAFFADLIDTYSADLNAARTEMRNFLDAHPAPTRGDRPANEVLEMERLQAEIDLAASRYATALDKEEETRLSMAQIESEARQTYFLIDAPMIPERPDTSLRSMVLSGGIFVVLGVLLSGGLIVGAALIDRSFRFPVDVIHRLGLPVLTMIPETAVHQGTPETLATTEPQPEGASMTAEGTLVVQSQIHKLEEFKSRKTVSKKIADAAV